MFYCSVHQCTDPSELWTGGSQRNWLARRNLLSWPGVHPMVGLVSPLQPAGEVTPKGLARGQENRATGQQTPTVLGCREQGNGRGTVLKTSLAPLSTAIGVQPRVSGGACSHMDFRTYTQHHAAATGEVRCGNMAWEGIRGRERETG